MWKKCKVRNVFWSGTLCMVGSVTLLGSFLFPTRIIRSLTLLKGGQKLRIETYSLFGKIRKRTVPLQNVSCSESRSRITDGGALSHHLGMKVKNKRLSLLMDQ